MDETFLALVFMAQVLFVRIVQHKSRLASGLNQAKAAGNNAEKATEDKSLKVAESQRGVEVIRLRQAIHDKEITVNFQPYFDVHSNKIVGYEALARWPQIDGSFISPEKFIRLAEETGQIYDLADYLLEAACNEASTWPSGLTLSFNVSALQLNEDGFAERILQKAISCDLSPKRLELELTESSLVADAKEANTQLRKLRDAGVRIAIDDLGTGYSSLLRLTHIPMDKLKIDRHFVARCVDEDRVRKIMQSMITLGKDLGVPVVAEGVETEGQLDVIRSMGCDIAQGFLLGHPRDARHIDFDLTYEANIVVPLAHRLRAS